MAGNVAYGTQCCPTDFTGSLGDRVRHCKELVAMLVQEQMVVPEVWPAHVPVKILRLQIKNKNVSKQLPQSARNTCHSVCRKARARLRFLLFSVLQCGRSC